MSEKGAVGDRIRELQRLTRVRNEELAEIADVHVKTVSQWRSNRQRPTDDNLRAIAPKLGSTFTYLKEGNGAEQPMMVREVPRVALGIPQRIRVWLQQFLLELVTAGVSDDEVDRIRRILSSDEMFSFYVGGEAKEYSEDEVLKGIQGHAQAFRLELRERGYKVPK